MSTPCFDRRRCLFDMCTNVAHSAIPDARIHHQSGIRIPRNSRNFHAKALMNHDESSSLLFPGFPTPVGNSGTSLGQNTSLCNSPIEDNRQLRARNRSETMPWGRRVETPTTNDSGGVFTNKQCDLAGLARGNIWTNLLLIDGYWR